MGFGKNYCVFLKRTVEAAVFSLMIASVPAASAGDGQSKETQARIAALKTMATALRNSAELVNSKRILAGHEALDGSICMNGLGDNCPQDESIALRCGYPDATPDGIIRALNAGLEQLGDELPPPDSKWVFVYKEWSADARQILVSLNGAPISDSFESEEELTFKHKCYIFYNTPCYVDPRHSKFDGNHEGIQIRLFTDGC
jgi:hypothetical protein